MDAVFLPARAMTLIADYLRIEYLPLLTKEWATDFGVYGHVVDVYCRRLRVRYCPSPRGLGPAGSASFHHPPRPLCRLTNDACSTEVRATGLEVGSTRLGFLWAGRAKSPLAMLASSALVDVSAFPPRPLPMPRSEEFGNFLLALACSSYIQLPSGQVLFASPSPNREESRLALNWMDLGSLQVTRTIHIDDGTHSNSCRPTLDLVDGDDAHVYLSEGPYGPCSAVNVDTGEITRSAWLAFDGDDLLDPVLAMPLRNGRWFFMENTGKYNVVVGERGGEQEAALDGEQEEEVGDLDDEEEGGVGDLDDEVPAEVETHGGQPLFRRFVQLEGLSDIGATYWLGGNLLLISSWVHESSYLYLARLDVDLLASCNSDDPPPQPLTIIDTYVMETDEDGPLGCLVGSLHREAKPYVRRTGDRLQVVIPAVDSSSVVLLMEGCRARRAEPEGRRAIEGGRIVYCQHVDGAALFPATAAHPGIEACWRLVREMQEERVKAAGTGRSPQAAGAGRG